MKSYFYLRGFWTANYMYRYLVIFYWEIPCFHLKMTIPFWISYHIVWLNTFPSDTIVVSSSAFAILFTLVTQKFIELWADKKKTSDSALGQSKSTKTININSIRIMHIFHYKWVSKLVNSNMPCDEQFLLCGKINPHRN
jgi:hypothetical protein